MTPTIRLDFFGSVKTPFLKGFEMNGYVCFWSGKRVEIQAETSYQGQKQALPIFQKLAGRKKVKSSDITVVLAEKEGKQVTHRPTM